MLVIPRVSTVSSVHPVRGAHCPNDECREFNYFPTQAIPRKQEDGSIASLALCTSGCGTLMAFKRSSKGGGLVATAVTRSMINPKRPIVFKRPKQFSFIIAGAS
jgi:hypothetical protein